ncbi:lipopolysaccharide/colanic/teichoic acid biosynthesis glycosyltransferase [Novosphingobium sp. 1529]|uniref:sugar transferase n=1 Tax=Novosphingobium sp. 1529 TaxID=3156424 RepID=UPI00339870D6
MNHQHNVAARPEGVRNSAGTWHGPSLAFTPDLSTAPRAARARWRHPASDPRIARAEAWTRAIDVIMAFGALVVFLPLMLAIAALVRFSDGGPVLFRHRRVGAGGRHFACLKFRSMCVDADARLRHVLETDPAARAEWEATHKLQNDPRITAVGRLLRKSSLDELPQLINVLRGDMSLVGPRPIVDAEVVRYGRHFAAYCAVRPGVTGLWQVARRHDTTYRRRVACDRLYRRARSLRLYFRILILTVPSVILARGAY